ncbi:Cytochrome P450 3A4 [Mactra antiquata]
MDTLWITCQLLVFLFTLGLIYLYHHFTQLRRLGIPGPTPWPIFGNILHQMIRGIENTDKEWTKKYGKIYGMYNGFKPTIVVSDINVIKSILIKDFSNFQDRPHNGNLPKLFENGLFFMRGHVWKNTRNIITPTFSTGKLKNLIPIVNKCAETLADNFTAVTGQQDVSVREYFVNFTMDAIASTAFGLDIDSQKKPNDPFVTNIDPIFKLRRLPRIYVTISAIIPGIGPLLRKLGFSSIPKESVQFYEDVGKALIEERRKKNLGRVDFLQLLMEAEFDENKQDHVSNNVPGQHNDGTVKKVMKLTDDEVNGQAFVFFLAGYETTASFLRYGSYVLALHPDVDEKLQNEIQQCIGDDEPNYENIGRLKYMEQFVHEVLRCYPPVTRLTRSTKSDITINNITIPAGSSIHVPVWQVQHNEEYYENPDKFDPDRFSPENRGSTDNVSFLAFGAGPRHCIGMRLALVEAKIALIYILRKVKFVKSEHTKVPLDLSHFGLMRPRQPVRVGVVKR